MKKFLYLLLAGFILPVSAFSQTSDILKHIYLNQEEKAEHKKNREIWINDMHRTPPELDWRVIESVNHLARIENRKNLLNDYILSGKNTKDQMLEKIIGSTGLKGKWIEKGSNNQSGRIHTADIDFQERFIYAASSGGNIWRGSLTGTDWTCLNNGMQIGSIQYVKVFRIGPTKRIVVVGNNPAAVWYTDDEGLTWNMAAGLDKPANWGSMQRGITVSGSNQLYVMTTEWDYSLSKAVVAVYMSEDFGENFKDVKKIDLSVNFCDIWSPEYHNASVYFIHKDTLSAISGTNVTNETTFSINHTYSSINQTLLRGSVVNNQILLTMLLKDKSKDSSYAYRTNDLKKWYHIGTAPVRTFMRNSFNVHYLDTSLLYVGGVDLWKSKTNGEKWDRVNIWWEYYNSPSNVLHADIPGVNYFRSPLGADLFLISTDGGIYISKDNIVSVENLSLKGLNVSQYYSGYTHRKTQGVYFLGSQDQGFQRVLGDKGGVADFEQTISGDYGHLNSSDDGQNLWSVYPGFAMLYQGADKQSFKSFSWQFKNDLSNWLWMPPIIANPTNPTGAYLVSGRPQNMNNNYAYIWNIELNGETIIHDSLPYNFAQEKTGRRPTAMAISPINTEYFYVLSDDGRFFISTDGGNNWTMDSVFKGPGGHYFYGNSIAVSETKFGRIYAAGNGYSAPGAYFSDDHGVNWTPIDSGLPKTLIYRIAVTPDDKYIFAATQAGPYVYIFEEERWFDMSAPETPDQTYWSVEFVPDMKTVRFVTYGRGAWDFEIESFTTGIKEKAAPALDARLEVYPNPVSEIGKVKVKLNKSVVGKLSLYDLDGRMVHHIFTGKINSDETAFSFERFTNEGNRLTQGNYILFLTADGLATYIPVKIVE